MGEANYLGARRTREPPGWWRLGDKPVRMEPPGQGKATLVVIIVGKVVALADSRCSEELSALQSWI